MDKVEGNGVEGVSKGAIDVDWTWMRVTGVIDGLGGFRADYFWLDRTLEIKLPTDTMWVPIRPVNGAVMLV